MNKENKIKKPKLKGIKKPKAIKKPRPIRKKTLVKKRKYSNITSSLEGDSDLKVYTRGAFVGGIIGGVGGLLIGKRIFLGIIIGSLTGGYIAYELNKKKNERIYTT